MTALAQTVPMVTGAPEIFAPGVVSGPANDGAPTLTPDGNTLYFGRAGASWGFILESHRAGGQWSQPQVASFSGQYSDSQPALSPDGQRLIFQSARPASGPATPATMHNSALWEVHRTADGWSEPMRLPDAVNISASIWKPSVAADGSVYFMAKAGSDKTFRLYRSQYAHATYQPAEPLAFSDGMKTDVDPEIAPDASFLIFSSAGRAAANDAHEHLYIVFKDGAQWGAIQPLRYEGDYEKNPADDGEARLSPDHQSVYFNSSRVVPIHASRTRQQAAEDFERLNLWDNGNSNVWSISIEPWLRGKDRTATKA